MMAAPGNDIGRQSADRVAALPEKPKRLSDAALTSPATAACAWPASGVGKFCTVALEFHRVSWQVLRHAAHNHPRLRLIARALNPNAPVRDSRPSQ